MEEHQETEAEEDPGKNWLENIRDWTKKKGSLLTHSPSPTLKTASMTSRTNLKQQLMREQIQQLDHKEKLKLIQSSKLQQSIHSNSYAINVPVGPSGVEVPPQILQVESKLANPTRYHVIQSQKRQVQQYLNNNIHGRSLLTTQSLPTVCEGNVATPIPQPVAAASMMEDFLEDIISLETGGKMLDADINLLEPSIAMPSTMPSSNAILDIFNNMGQVSLPGNTSASCPTDIQMPNDDSSIQLVDMNYKALSKDRQKKDNHNMIERRRRFNINDRIKELGTLLPKNNDPYYDLVRDLRHNKGTILKASVDYIKRLKKDSDRMKLVEERKKQLEQQNKKLLLRIQELELHAKSHGIPVTETTWQPASSLSLNTMLGKPDLVTTTLSSEICSHYVPSDILIKQEPTEYLHTSTANMTLNSIANGGVVGPYRDLIDDDFGTCNGDPMLSSPLVNSPSSHQSLDETLSPDSMDFVS
ncbi:Microphthalmia-associated transcription factor [Nymphon striatum]|nr:Microphthalmia-associated transcription factor [Nymphon striatum]